MTLMLRKDSSTAMPMPNQNAVRVSFSASVCRCQRRSVSAMLLLSDIEDPFDRVGGQFAEEDDGDDGYQDSQDEVVFEALEGGK